MTPDHHYPCPPDILSASPGLKPPMCLRVVTSDGDVLMCCHHHLNHHSAIIQSSFPGLCDPTASNPLSVFPQSLAMLDAGREPPVGHHFTILASDWSLGGGGGQQLTRDNQQPQLHNIMAIIYWQQQHYTGAATK